MPGSRTYSYDEWTDSSMETFPWQFTNPTENEGLTLRFTNSLDTDVDISVAMSDVADSNFERPNNFTFWSEGLLGPLYKRAQGSMNNTGQSTTVTQGETETWRLTTLWPRVRFEVTPVSQPTSDEPAITHVTSTQ